MFHINSASFDYIQVTGSLVGKVSASIDFSNTTVTASIISASNISGYQLRPVYEIYTNTQRVSVVSTNQTDEVLHYYSFPENYFKPGDFISFQWYSTIGEATSLQKLFKYWISSGSNTGSTAGATQWGGEGPYTVNTVAVQHIRYAYISSNTTMKILGAGTTNSTVGNPINVAPSDVTVPHVSSSWNLLLTGNRSGSDITRVDWSFLQTWRF